MDGKAKLLMNNYKLLQIEMVKAAKEKRDANIVESIKQRLLSKQEGLNDYDITLNYLKAKRAFDDMMKQVNDIINFAMTGKDSSCSSGGCGSCGSCK